MVFNKKGKGRNYQKREGQPQPYLVRMGGKLIFGVLSTLVKVNARPSNRGEPRRKKQKHIGRSKQSAGHAIETVPYRSCIVYSGTRQKGRRGKGGDQRNEVSITTRKRNSQGVSREERFNSKKNQEDRKRKQQFYREDNLSLSFPFTKPLHLEDRQKMKKKTKGGGTRGPKRINFRQRQRRKNQGNSSYLRKKKEHSQKCTKSL